MIELFTQNTSWQQADFEIFGYIWRARDIEGKPSAPWYLSCANDGCLKKVIVRNEGGVDKYECAGCNDVFDRCNRRYFAKIL